MFFVDEYFQKISLFLLLHLHHLCLLVHQSLDADSLLDDDTELLTCAVAEAADFPELAAASAHLARLRQRVRP